MKPHVVLLGPQSDTHFAQLVERGTPEQARVLGIAVRFCVEAAVA